MLFPIGTKINGQILREHLTLFPKANHRSVEELILNRKFSSIEKTLEKHCKNIARVIINYSISLRKIYQKDERVLFLKINISQNILRYFTFTCRAKKVHRSKKKKNTFTPSIGSKIRKEKSRRIQRRIHRAKHHSTKEVTTENWTTPTNGQTNGSRLHTYLCGCDPRATGFVSVRSFLADSQSASCVLLARWYGRPCGYGSHTWPITSELHGLGVAL